MKRLSAITLLYRQNKKGQETKTRPVILSAAKNLAPRVNAYPGFSGQDYARGARFFAALRMTWMLGWRSHSNLAGRASVCLLVVLVAVLQAWPPPVALAAPPEGFASPYIGDVWRRDDGPVASGQVSRTWMWGPGPFYTNYEPFEDAAEGNYLAQYFDKGRLEIADPGADPKSPWYVTSGLLVKEMVSGRIDVGGGGAYVLGPANVAVAGDTGSGTSPTYAAFEKLTGRVANRVGYAITAVLDANGVVRESSTPPPTANYGRYEEASGHNWAEVFWRFVNSADRPARFDWLYTLGYPISDPYWVRVPVGGKPRTVLVQLFERRTLTFNTANPQATQVEMGNAGRHYYQWRYADTHEASLQAKYDVRVQVGAAPLRATSVSESMTLTNSTGLPLNNVILRAAWHHWDGVFALKSARAGGTAVETHWRHGINLEVLLPQPLAPGATATLQLEFELEPRPVGGRTGYDKSNDILSLGDMLPTVVPWENGGWAFYPYSTLGDLGYYAAGDYSVEVASMGAEKLVVGGTGKMVAKEADGTRWRFSAQKVRDVAYVVSPRFIDPLHDSSMARKEGSVQILAYFLPGHKAAGQRQLELVAPGLRWFGQNIGPYPFDTYTIAEMGTPLEPTDNYAQEYPMAYFVPSTWLNLGTTPGTWTWYIPVHEVGHQWFYSTVGNNQLTDPWLDEALTTYITAEYVRANYPAYYERAWASMSGAANGSRPVSSGVFSGFANENQYSATVYDTGVQMLDKVRLRMGDAAFYDALRDYYKTFQFKRATPAGLLTILQAHSKADLKSIFSDYLGY
jgi:hypothetical protein